MEPIRRDARVQELHAEIAYREGCFRKLIEIGKQDEHLTPWISGSIAEERVCVRHIMIVAGDSTSMFD